MLPFLSFVKELTLSKDAAAANEERFSAEVSTVSPKRDICLDIFCSFILVMVYFFHLIGRNWKFHDC